MHLNNVTYASRNLFTACLSCDVAVTLRPTAALLSKCPPFFLLVNLMTFVAVLDICSLAVYIGFVCELQEYIYSMCR